MSMITRDIRTKPHVIVNEERCVGCQECIVRCPTEALSLDTVRWLAAADDDKCIGCRQCVRTCPFCAVTVEGPVVVVGRTRWNVTAKPVEPGDVSEVRPGLTSTEAEAEAKRCLDCPDPTCVYGCPAHNDIPGFIGAVREGDLERAESIIARTSCLPDICSRVCDWSRQCEGGCTWALAGEAPVAIGRLERYVTDNSRVPGVAPASERGKGLSIGIIGTGPGSLAAAWELVSAGASVTLYDKDDRPGGVMRWGIPSYVLPDAVVQRPVDALQAAGVEFHMNTEIGPGKIDELLGTHDGVIAAYGAALPLLPDLPGSDLDGVIDALHFLTEAKRALAENRTLGKFQNARLLVLGGSNTAIDAARTALRLGAAVTVVHRREEEFSRARTDEIAEAKREGVVFLFGMNIARLEGLDGKLKRAVLVSTRTNKLGEANENLGGTERSVEADAVVLATGFGLDPSFSPVFGSLPLRQPRAVALYPDRQWDGSGLMSATGSVGELAWAREYGLRTSWTPRRERVWLIGDALTGPATVVGAMAQGRLAGRSILAKHTKK